MARIIKSWAWILIILPFISCEDEEGIPFSDVPEIELIGISHDSVVEWMDTEIISVRYQDGNGDLGFVEPDQYAIFVRDIRLANFDGFYIGPIAPLDQSVPVTGQVNIEFPNLFIFGNRDYETTQFEVKMIDRSGNESNLITTDPVVIVRK